MAHDHLEIYTIGHSDLPAEQLITNLRQQGLRTLVDVRSIPYSQHNPQFNREFFATTLAVAGISYLFGGEHLGGRPQDPTCYKNGAVPVGKAKYLQLVDYAQVARRPWYQQAIAGLIQTAVESPTAILCSEENPQFCHRHHLIAQTLLTLGLTVWHIRKDGRRELARPDPEKSGQYHQLRLLGDGDQLNCGSPLGYSLSPLESPIVDDYKHYAPQAAPSTPIKLYTIGFTKKSAETFFSLLRDNGIDCLVDIRLHPHGQLAGFTRQSDLPYLLAHLADCQYHHFPLLAPTKAMLSEYRKGHDWERYAQRFEALMEERTVPDCLDRNFFANQTCCLLCSEATPDQCHRRLVTERLARYWPGTEVVHLL